MAAQALVDVGDDVIGRPLPAVGVDPADVAGPPGDLQGRLRLPLVPHVGQADPPLSDAGKLQAAEAGLALGMFDAVWSSDLQPNEWRHRSEAGVTHALNELHRETPVEWFITGGKAPRLLRLGMGEADPRPALPVPLELAALRQGAASKIGQLTVGPPPATISPTVPGQTLVLANVSYTGSSLTDSTSGATFDAVPDASRTFFVF